MSRWFRFYDEALDDPKVQKLSGDLFKTWVNLLCMASKDDGRIKADEIAFRLRVSEAEANKRLAALVRAGLLDKPDEGDLRPHNWNSRQFKSDGSTERVKRFRERARNAPETLHATGPEAETEQNTETKPNPNQQQRLIADEPKEAAAASLLVDEKEIERRCVQATGWQGAAGISAIVELVRSGVDLEERVLPILRTLAADFKKKGAPPPGSFVYALKAIRDPSRRPAPAEVVVDQLWVALGSPKWHELIARGKKESFLRMMLKRADDGSEGVYADPAWLAGKVAA